MHSAAIDVGACTTCDVVQPDVAMRRGLLNLAYNAVSDLDCLLEMMSMLAY